jgi:HSP20 family protein
MNLVRFNRHPFFESKMDDLMKDIFNQEAVYSGSNPAVNIREDEKEFTIELAAPGLKKDDFKINLENRVLSISKESEEKKEEVKDNYTRREFVYNSFSRSFRLPKSILEDKIKADYKDGVLTISLPKDEKVTLTREISVN